MWLFRFVYQVLWGLVCLAYCLKINCNSCSMKRIKMHHLSPNILCLHYHYPNLYVSDMRMNSITIPALHVNCDVSLGKWKSRRPIRSKDRASEKIIEPRTSIYTQHSAHAGRRHARPCVPLIRRMHCANNPPHAHTNHGTHVHGCECLGVRGRGVLLSVCQECLE